MPALIGGFGKINEKKHQCINNVKPIGGNNNLGPYLAGLIEADGSFAVHNINTNAKPYSPKLLIVFSKPDKPLAEKLSLVTGVGTIQVKTDANYVIWHIQTKQDLIKIISIINGYMRTPKIEALHRAIDWFNHNTEYNMEKKAIDKTPIDSNSWLAGFTDGDGNFSINLTNRKKLGNITSKRVQVFFRIEIRQTYHRETNLDFIGTSYFNILTEIALYLNVNLYSRVRRQGEKTFYAFLVVSHNLQSHEKVIDYFNKYPLLSSKVLAYKD